MESKHTPGPWCSCHRDFDGIPVEHSVWQCVCDRPEDPDPQSRKICVMQTSNNVFARRDSVFIAAAPDMDEALAWACKQLDEERNCGEYDCDTCPIRAARKKARGE